MTTATIRWPVQHRPKVMTAGRFFLDDRRFEVTYEHKHTLAVHLHEYAATVRIGRQTFRLRPGDVTVSPPDTPSSYDLPRPGTHLCLHLLRPVGVAGPTMQLPMHVPQIAGDAAAIRMQRVIDWQVMNAQNPLASPAASALAHELLLWLASRAGTTVDQPTRGGVDQAVREVARLIESKPLQSPSVPELARAVGLSQNYLARGFKARFGVTIPRYRLLRRLQLAKELLMITNLPVKVVAARVGIPDQHHFNKMFRQLTGAAPSVWREKVRH